MRSNRSRWGTGFYFSCLTLLAFLGSNQDVEAWQFRDLDDVKEAAKQELIDLIPTDAAFVAPVINADEASSEEVQKAKAKARAAYEAQRRGKLTVGSKSKPHGQSKKAAKRPTPVKTAAGKTAANSTKKPEPVPMPEINTPDDLAEQPAGKQVPEQTATDGEGNKDITKDAKPSNSPDVETAKFNNVQPGTTQAKDLADALGESIKTIKNGDGTRTIIYKLPSFKQVDVTVNDESDTVSGVMVHLDEPLEVSDIEQQLNLAGFEPVPVPDEFGEVLGQAYPERGLLLSFTEDIESLQVNAILLEAVSGEMFRLRAQYDFEHRYTQNLNDLNEAIRLNPDDSDAHWHKAEVLDAVGRSKAAIRSVNKAIRLRPTSPLYRLTRARLYAKTNQHAVAIDEVQEILDEIDMPGEIEAKAYALLGDLKAMGPNADHQEALKHHLRAIDLASKVVDTRRFAVRRMAKHVLVDAHVSVARDIAMGNFQRQDEVVPKWLLRATELADEFIADDAGDELLQMYILRDTLGAYAELNQANFDAAIASEEAIQTGRRFIADAEDELHKLQVERVLAETLLHSSRIARSRGRFDSAMKYANNALAQLDNTSGDWQNTSHDQYLRGQLYFIVGSIHAIQQEDHEEAVQWYAKARDVFADSDFTSPLYTTRGHGEMYVSMGLSLWETDQEQKAINLSQKGADLMKKAVEEGSLGVAALAVPYGNLATMHGKLGDNKKSQEFAKLVAKVEKVMADTKQR